MSSASIWRGIDVIVAVPLIRLALRAIHLLPQGEKDPDCELPALSPSPLAGEGARRADEGVGT